MTAPTGPRIDGVWRRCGSCDRLSYSMADHECFDCGYTGACHSCGVMLYPTDPHTPTACSDACMAELAEWVEADRKAKR